MTVIHDFSEETNNGKGMHNQAEARKEKYVELVQEGYTYEEILDELRIKKNTLTKYALQTNMIPSLSEDESDFDRNLIYHCIKEAEEVKKQNKAEKSSRQKRIKDKKRFQYNPDWWMDM